MTRILQRRPRRPERGWTIIELLLVLSIIGILTALVTRAVLRPSVQRNYQRARAEIRAIELALEAYKADYGAYPVSAAYGPGSSCGSGIPYVFPSQYNSGTWVSLPAWAATNACYARMGVTRGTSGLGCSGSPPVVTAYPVDDNVRQSAAALWVWLYRERVLAGQKPYIDFSPKQLADWTVSGVAQANPGSPAGMPLNVQMVVNPWGNPYTYNAFPPPVSADLCIKRKNQQSFDLISAGPDGIYENADDVTNWEAH